MKCTRFLPLLLASMFVLAPDQISSAAQLSESDSQRNRQPTDQRERQDNNRRSRSDQQSRQEGELSAWRFIEDFDENGNGVLEREELPRRMREQLGRLDRNGDNRLTAQELRQHGNRASSRHRAGPSEVIYIWITDADSGHLSLDELQQAYKSLQEIDEDGDGQLSRDELRQRRQELFARWAGTVTDRLDENGDSRISPSEAQDTFLLSMFDRLDANRDGAISERELTQCIASGMHRAGQQETRTGSRQDSQSEDNRQHDERDRQSSPSEDDRQQDDRRERSL